MQYKFSNCILDIEAHTLTKEGKAQRVEPMVFDLLCLLVLNSGDLVTRDQMIDEIWQGRIVSESAVSARIAAMRRAVGDDGKTQSIIRTVPRRGLQFVAELTLDENIKSPDPVEETRQTVRYATADDGVKLAYATSGNGPPVFRVQHFPTHLELEWQEYTDRKVFDVLGQSHTLVRYDQRGSGLSDIEVDFSSIQHSVEDIKSVADAAGLNRFALFGTSGGVLKAVEFAVKYPERVSHLVLLSGYAEGRIARDKNRDSNSPETIEIMQREGWEIPGSAFIKAYLSLYLPTGSPELLQTYTEIVQASSSVENVLREREMGNNHSILDILGGVTAPTLVMHSRNDAVHPLSEAKKLASGIADAEFLVLESPNHYPMLDEPSWQIHMDAMLEFLKRDSDIGD